MDATPETIDAAVTGGVVLVDFWAPWCGPCRVLTPQLDRVASENPSLRLVKVNVEAHPELGERWDVSGLPTLVLLSDGKEVARKVGAAGGYSAVKQLVLPHLTRPAT